MSTPEEREAAQRKIAALEAEIAEYSTLPLAERAQWKEVITAKENRLNRLLDAQATASTESRGKNTDVM
jgi:hypothetical protein